MPLEDVHRRLDKPTSLRWSNLYQELNRMREVLHIAVGGLGPDRTDKQRAEALALVRLKLELAAPGGGS